MRFIRIHLPAMALVTVACALAVAAPASSASAQVWPWPIFVPPVNNIGGQVGPEGCGSNAPSGVGAAGATFSQACGSNSVTGPAIGQIASVIGPTTNVNVIAAPVIITVSAAAVQQ